MVLAIYCAGSFGREVLTLAKKIDRWDSVVFVDDVTEKESCDGIRIIRFKEALNMDDVRFVIASGEPWQRMVLREKLTAHDCKMDTLMADDVTFANNVTIEEGSIIFSRCVFENDIKICSNVIVGGDTRMASGITIGTDCYIGTGTFMGDYTTVGERVFVAPRCLTRGRLKIGDDSIVGIGSVVFRNVRKASIVIGNPAKKIGVNADHKVFDLI